MYCSLDDLKKNIDEAVIEQLTDDAGAGAIDTAKVTEAIANADSLIDGFCGSRYTIPFATVPPIIKNISIALAIYFLHKRRRGVTDEQQRDYDAQLKLLKQLSDGIISLGVQPVPADSPGDVAAGETDDDDREFTKTTLSGF